LPIVENTVVEQYIVSTRVIVCFLNRLARRLELEVAKKNELSQPTNNLFVVRLAILQLEDKLLLELIHEFKHCSLFGEEAWRNFRVSRGKDLLDMIERDYAYVKAELEDHLCQIESLSPTLVNNSYVVFSSGIT